MNNLFGREPALWLGAVGAVISLGIGFGLNVTPAQFGLIMAAVGAVLALITRSQVYSPASTQVALKMPPGSSLPLLDSVLQTGVWVSAGDTHSEVVSKVEKAEEKQ